MKSSAVATIWALCLAFAIGGAIVAAQSKDAITISQAAAKAAAQEDWHSLYTQLCSPASQPPAPPGARGGAARGAAAPGSPRQIPDRAQWHREPAKVFDNLYFLGMNDVAAWAVTTSDGIILIDALYDYSVEDEIVEGMKKLGLDPAKIKIVIVTHGHGDHSAGAKYLQEHYGARIILSAADWDLLDRTTGPVPKPTRDLVAKDGEKVTLGDTTLTLYLTPGHTPGTISLLIPVKDAGKPHVAAMWGGTAISRNTGSENLEKYIASARRFSGIAARARADLVISNHDRFGEHLQKIEAMKNKPGPSPFIVGSNAVTRYLTVVGECGKAVLASVQ